MEIKVSEHKYSKVEDIKSGDIFSYDKRFWLMLEETTPDGRAKAANLCTGYVGMFNSSTTVMPRPDLCLSQK